MNIERKVVLTGWGRIWLLVFTAGLIWSAYQPLDVFTWLLEVFPALLAILVIAVTRRRFPLTTLCYTLILIHCLILMIGGHYTYAEVPAFDYIGDLMGWQRNNYDKVGHLAQGFVPAMIAREILIRREIVNGRAWTHFLTVNFCLALSAFYELIEWWVALLSDEAAESFLGTQGYVWDTQSDMAWALLGALLALFSLAGLHDRQLAALHVPVEQDPGDSD